MKVRLRDSILLFLSIKPYSIFSYIVSRQNPDFDQGLDIDAPQDNAQISNIDSDLKIVANNDIPQTSITPEDGNITEVNNNLENSVVPPMKNALDPDGNVLPFPFSPDLLDNLHRGVEDLISPPKRIPQQPKPKSPHSSHPEQLPESIKNPIQNWNDGCDSNPSKSCEKATPQIIYPRACSAKEENESVTLKINEMVGGTSKVYISEDKRCGVFFWATKLKRSQIQRLQKMKAIRAIAPDGKIQSYNTPAESPNKGRRLKKRSTVVSRKTSNERDLSYISTPSGVRLRDTYTLFQEAGTGTTAYILGDGLNPSNDEFTRIPDGNSHRSSIIKDWLYGLGVQSTESNQVPMDDETACGASKVAGSHEGVAPNADVVIVKIRVEISSYLDGVQKAIEHIADRIKLYPETRGRNVFLFQYGWEVAGQMDANQRALFRQIQTLTDADHQVVVVAAAGFARSGVRHVNSVPALFSVDSRTPIITVGSITVFTGKRPNASPMGSAVSLVAPHSAFCAGSAEGNFMVHMQGTGVSASIVAGLMLYFMSLEADGVGDWITQSLNVPKTARTYLRSKAFRRKDDEDLAVWNGLSPFAGDDGTYGWIPFAPEPPGPN